MLYAIWAWDCPDSLPKRKKVRSEHLARIHGLRDAGRLILAGPHPAIDTDTPGEAGFSGSLIVAEFDDLEAARQWIADDPYVTEGIFERYEVKPFKQVLP